MSAQEYLESIYYDPSHGASFSGPEKLYRTVKEEGKFKIGRNKIKQFLQNQEEYSLQRDTKKKRRRRKIVVSGVDSQWAVDLADVQNLKDDNDGVKYFLVVIDVFSKYLFVEMLKDKKASTVLEGMKKILDKGRRPSTIFSDKGGEINNKLMRKELKKRNIEYFTSQNEDIKTSIAERVIRTLKNKLYRFFQRQKSYRYVEELDKIIDGYNKSKHRSLSYLSPIQINKDNEAAIWDRMYNEKTTTRKHEYQKSIKKAPRRTSIVFKFKMGDYVRLSYVRYVFQRDYQQKWTTEIFKISDRYLKENIPQYKVVDLLNGEIVGSFYQWELQKVDKDFDFWSVESILKSRMKKGKKEYLIKWSGYADKFNSWVLASEVKDLKTTRK